LNSRPIRSATWVYAVAALLAIALLAAGITPALKHQDYTLIAAGGLSLIAVLAALPLAMSLHQARLENAIRTDEKFAAVAERYEQFSVMMTLISEQQLLSDRAKSVAFREKERDAIRNAIQEEIAHGNYDSAGALANEIEASFGQKQEANRFREDISTRRAEIVRRQINDAAAVIDRHCRAEQWQQAAREAERLAQLFPADEQARNLPADIETRRNNHKQQLIQAFQDARSRNDIDGSIEIVKQLDIYLSPTEAEAYQEQVRSVFKDKLNNLRAQFSLAVHDQHWADATRVGETIIRDFPNTQMAKEVREKMDALRQRAAAPEAARA
jgi:hypothetical protein